MFSKKELFIALTLIFSVVIYLPSHAAIEAVEFDNPELLERYQGLIAELRCTVCQNQNLADSDADLAKDLRRKTEEMLKAGQSNEEVLAYMRERYGDFVLYRPPLTASTYLLWLGPFVLLIIAAASILITISNKQKFIKTKQLELAEDPKLELEEENRRRKKIRDLLNN